MLIEGTKGSPFRDIMNSMKVETMPTITAVLNPGQSPANSLNFNGALNTLTITQPDTPGEPFTSSTTVSLLYSTSGVTYAIYHLSGGTSGTQVAGPAVTVDSANGMTATFRVSSSGGSPAGGGNLLIDVGAPTRVLQLQIPYEQ